MTSSCLYGWIPTLGSTEPHVLRGHPISSNARYSVSVESTSPLRMSVRTNYGGSEYRICVEKEHDFLRFVGLNSLEPRVRMHIVNDLFRHLKASFHVDITHDPLRGLPVIAASSMESAAVCIADQIVSRCERFVYDADNVQDVRTLRTMYLECSGFVEYGGSFMDLHTGMLGPLAQEFRDRLESISRFSDAIYSTRMDVIQDDLAESADRMSRSTQTMSYGVLYLTWISAVFVVAAFMLDHGGLSAGAIAAIILVMALPTSLHLALLQVHRRMHAPSAEEVDPFHRVRASVQVLLARIVFNRVRACAPIQEEHPWSRRGFRRSRRREPSPFRIW